MLLVAYRLEVIGVNVPCVRDDDVVEWLIPPAEAGQSYPYYHCMNLMDWAEIDIRSSRCTSSLEQFRRGFAALWLRCARRFGFPQPSLHHKAKIHCAINLLGE